MPPKPKFTRDEIAAAALGIVSEKGAAALTAKELGAALGSSASPIFTVFRSMSEVRSAAREAAMRRFESFGGAPEANMPAFKQIGMRMLMFSQQEPRLFQFLFMQENSAGSFDELLASLGALASSGVEMLCRDYDLSAERARQVFESMWIFTFGIGALCATGACRFSEEKLGRLLTEQFTARMLLTEER